MLCGGCASVEGADEYALFDTYTSPDGAYQFRYLSPPWVFVEDDEAGERQLLAVSPENDNIGFQIERGFLNARFKMVVEVLDGESVRSAVVRDLERWDERGADVGAPGTFESIGGNLGLRVDVDFTDRHLVSVYHNLEPASVVVMRVAAQETLETHDMALLFRGLAPDGGDR